MTDEFIYEALVEKMRAAVDKCEFKPPEGVEDAKWYSDGEGGYFFQSPTTFYYWCGESTLRAMMKKLGDSPEEIEERLAAVPLLENDEDSP